MFYTLNFYYMIVQNCETIFIKAEQGERVFYLPKDKLQGKTIKYIIPLFGLLSFNGVPIVGNELRNKFFMDLYDIDHAPRIIGQSMCVNNQMTNYKKLLDFALDLDLCRIYGTTANSQSCYIPLLFIYDCKLQGVANIADNFITLQVPKEKGVYKLSDCGGYILKGKAIKKIITLGLYPDVWATIRTTENQNSFLNVPCALFENTLQTENRDLAFENIFIDPDNTTINNESDKGDNIYLTFIY